MKNCESRLKEAALAQVQRERKFWRSCFSIEYLNLNKKNPDYYTDAKGRTCLWHCILSMPEMISPNLTASWEKGLTGVADGSISEGDYMKKLEAFVVAGGTACKRRRLSQNWILFYRSVQPHRKGKTRKANHEKEENDEGVKWKWKGTFKMRVKAKCV